jgi:hypothetical protein
MVRLDLCDLPSSFSPYTPYIHGDLGLLLSSSSAYIEKTLAEII